MAKTATPRGRKKPAAIIHTDRGEEFKAVRGPQIDEMAIRWSYLIRNRAFWEAKEREAIRTRLRRELKEMGYRQADFEALGAASYIEVEIPYQSEPENWAARIFPWEFVLTSVMEGAASGHVPIVARRLASGGRKRTAAIEGDLAFVESAPGRLADLFSFKREEELVFKSMGSLVKGKFTVVNPSLSRLRQSLRSLKPAIVHFTGVDLHQGAELLKRRDIRFRDGLYLAKEGHPAEEEAVEATDVADALADTQFRPQLVGLNMYHSAPRIAPLTVAAGAEAVVGFQDVVDDTIAEVFFAEFYRNLAATPGALRAAFESSLRGLMGGGVSLDGAGIVLWVRRSLLPDPQAQRPAEESYSQPLTALTTPIDQAIQIDIAPVTGLQLNYAALHNGGFVFDRFSVINRTGKRIENLRVRTSLFLDAGSFDNSTSLRIAGPGEDLRPALPLPLVGAQLRRFRESVLTTLKITAEWNGAVVADHNLQLRILPINEWRDTDKERQWLPSFVQPQDAAVLQVLAAAERHLRSITDDPGAGFDGYQQVDEKDEDSTIAVDNQVRAIWAALIHDLPLAYINPPPTFSELSQRIRSPSEVLEGRRGTCIDLAVLVASILEYVDIHPAVILLKGHAFPAYWRTEEAREEFWGTTHEALSESLVPVFDGHGQAHGKLDDRNRDYVWMTKATGYGRIVEAVSAGDLVPIESVWMTFRKSFAEALEAGRENLEIKREFECLVDIGKAREKGVLPLPERD